MIFSYLLGCGHVSYLTNHMGDEERMVPPATIYVRCAFPKKDFRLILNSANFWNKTLKRKMFEVVTECDMIPPDPIAERTLVFIDYDGSPQVENEEGNINLALTKSAVAGRDITVSHTVFRKEWVDLGDDALKEAVARHELGHVMGLKHTDDENCLMYHTFDEDADYIAFDPCRAEVEALKEVYTR